jgi:hypothetical protein
MVAQHSNTPPEPTRGLSPDVEEQLQQALRAFVSSGQSVPGDDIRAAVAAAGSDARARGLLPEELLLVFKGLEQQIGASLSAKESASAASLRARLIHALLGAYYDR